MARRSKQAGEQKSGEERIESSGPAAIPGSDAIPDGELYSADGEDKPASPKKAAAEEALAEAEAEKTDEAEKDDEPKPPAAVKKFYRITRGGMVRAETGHRTRMHDGKIVDTANYNLERLRQQGIKMEEVSEEDSLLG